MQPCADGVLLNQSNHTGGCAGAILYLERERNNIAERRKGIQIVKCLQNEDIRTEQNIMCGANNGIAGIQRECVRTDYAYTLVLQVLGSLPAQSRLVMLVRLAVGLNIPLFVPAEAEEYEIVRTDFTMLLFPCLNKLYGKAFILPQMAGVNDNAAAEKTLNRNLFDGIVTAGDVMVGSIHMRTGVLAHNQRSMGKCVSILNRLMLDTAKAGVCQAAGHSNFQIVAQINQL